MNRLLLLVICQVAPITSAMAQILLWVNPYTEQYSIFSGQRSDSTDKCSRGVVNVSATGPLLYKVTPSDLVILEQESKTWKGEVYPDLDNLCPPGQSVPAQLRGAYSFTYCRPAGLPLRSGQRVIETWDCGQCPVHPKGGKHEKINDTGTKVYDFIIYVMDLTLPDTIKLCGKGITRIQAKGYPENGEYEYNWKITGSALTYKYLPKLNAVDIGYDMYAGTYGDGSAEVSFKTGNITVTKTCYIKLPKRSPEEELADLDKMLEEALVKVRAKYPGTGKGWGGNVGRDGPHCDEVYYEFSAIIGPQLVKEKFCHYEIGSLFNSGWLPFDLAAHIYIGIRDKNGKIKYVVDPWRHGDVVRRRAPVGLSHKFTAW